MKNPEDLTTLRTMVRSLDLEKASLVSIEKRYPDHAKDISMIRYYIDEAVQKVVHLHFQLGEDPHGQS